VCVLGAEKGLPLIETVPGVSGRMVRLLEDGKAVKTTSPRFPKTTTEPDR
jgi:hypothetical protein